MKTLLTTFFLLLNISLFSQNYTLHPYSVTNNHEGVGTVGNRETNLFFNFYKMHLGQIDDSLILSNVDTICYEIRTFNISNNTKKSISIKSSFDTIYYSWTHTPYFNKTDSRYYFGTAKISKNQITPNFTIQQIAQHYYVESIDTNLNNRKIVELQLPSPIKSYNQCNKLLRGDSLIFAVSADTSKITNPIFCKLSLKNGNLIDTLKLIDKFANGAPFGHSGFIKMDWVNDSVIILLSDYIHYVNVNSMKLLDTFLFQFPIWQDYEMPTSVKFNVSDTSYLYNGTKNNKQYFYKANSNGLAYKLFEVPINTYPVFQTNDINTAYNNFDYLYLNHIYSANTPLRPLTDTFALCHSSINGVTDWIKIITTPTKCGFINVTALEDSSMFAFIQLYQANDSTKYDVYYLKLDQFGNQIFPLGMEKNSLKIINEPIIYPNPSNGQFYIGNLNLSEIKSITILNSNGQALKKINNSLIIDISELPTQTYFIEIKTNKGNIIKKIIKQ